MSNMNTHKAELVSAVQKWVALDTQLKMANEKIRAIRDAKHQMTDLLCSQMGDAKIEISDGVLKVVERNEYKPLTFAYIEDCLREIIKNEDHVVSILEYLRDNREINVVREIRRSSTK